MSEIETFRSLPGARFILDGETVWLHLETPSGKHAVIDLSAVAYEHAFNAEALNEFCAHIKKLAAEPY